MQKEESFSFLDLPVAILRAKWGSVSKNGVASFLGNGIAITTKEGVSLNKEKPEEIILAFPKNDGGELKFKAICREEPLVDPQIEALDIFENDQDLGSLLGNFGCTHLEIWEKHWKKEKLYIAGFSAKNSIMAEALDPKLLPDGFLEYETRLGNGQVGNPLIFKTHPADQMWTLLGIHAFYKNGKGFGWPITLGVSDQLSWSAVAVGKIWQKQIKRLEEKG
jgi:hypothetical protein